MTPWEPPPSDPYVELVDDAAHDAALRERGEARGRDAHAARLASWVGTLRDLAERRLPVVLSVTGGRRHRGSLVGVATDHLALQAPDGRLVLIALDTVRLLRPEPGRRVGTAMGDREVPVDRTLADALDRFADACAPVTLVLRDVVEPLDGTPLAVGEDVLTLRTSSVGTAFVPLAAVAELIITGHP